MDIIKVPSWWGNQAQRPNTVHVSTARNHRTRTELLDTRKSHNYRSNTRFKEVPNEVPHYEPIAAGSRLHAENYRDRVTIDENFDHYQLTADIKMNEQAQGYSTKYSSLTAMKKGKLLKEKRDTQLKSDQLLKNKSQAEIFRVQTHTNMAKMKVKSKVRSSRSQVDIRTEEIDPRNPTLAYVKDPDVRTQKKLFGKRKKDFLKDMRKCEKIYANHKNSEQRLQNREN